MYMHKCHFDFKFIKIFSDVIPHALILPYKIYLSPKNNRIHKIFSTLYSLLSDKNRDQQNHPKGEQEYDL